MLNYVIEHFPFPILLVSKEEKITYANLFCSQLFGYEPKELIGKNFSELTSPDYLQSDLSLLADFQRNMTFLFSSEKKVIHKLGQEIWVKQTVVPIKFDSETYNYLIVCLENISIQKARQEILVERDDLFYSFFHENNAIKLLLDPSSGKIMDVNQAACDFYGYSRSEILNMTIFDINAMTKEQIELELKKAKSTKQTYFHFPHRLANGEIRIVEVHTGPIKYKNQNYLLSIIHDITNQYHIIQEEKNEFLSKFLTQRSKLLQTLDNTINSFLKNTEINLALIWIDIDHFSNIKEQYPQDITNELIQNLKTKLQLEFNTYIYLLGEDEFGLLLPIQNNKKEINFLIKNLFHIFKEPFQIKQEKISITASFGISIIENKELEAKRIFELTSEALLEAKLKGRNTFQISNPYYCSLVKNQLETEKILESEISKSEFDLYFQPILKLFKTVHAFDCVSKWKNPKLFKLSPSEIDDILFSSEIYKFYLKNFLEKIELEILEWQKENFFINNILFPIHLENFQTSQEWDFLLSTLEKATSNKSRFILRINSSFLKKKNSAFERIREIQKLCFRICLDIEDISSNFLHELEKLNLDYLRILSEKFDFLNTKKLDLFQFVHNFFKDLQTKIILHEINTPQEYEKMISIGYEFFQGDYFGKYHREKYTITECLAKGYYFE